MGRTTRMADVKLSKVCNVKKRSGRTRPAQLYKGKKREQLESHQERGGREEEERESSLAKDGVVVEVRPEG